MHCIVKHRRPYRTRLIFPALRGREDHCAQLRASLAELPGATSVHVRPRSGAVIVEHPREVISLAVLRAGVTATMSDGIPVDARQHRHGLGRNGKRDPVHHVPGAILLLSGLYLLYLSIKQLFVPMTVPATLIGRLSSLPTLAALGLSLPIQRQALTNLRRTGRPDMGLISTALLYLSIFTGNVLAAFTVFWLFNLSSWIENRIRIRTRQAVRDMLASPCTRAWLVRDDMEIEVAAADLMPGDLIALRRGCTIPADGVVAAGTALVDEAAMTGEDTPMLRGSGDAVLAGTIIADGEIRVRVERAGETTRLAAIIRLIEATENDPGELQRTSLRFSRAMVPVSLALAATAFLLTGDPLRAMAVLIITCPCAPRLATSVAVSSAMGLAASRGILIKGGQYVEIAGRVDTLVLDKTGTLTDRTAEVTAIRVHDQRFRPETVLQLAAAAVHTWPHPVSRAVTARAEALGRPLPPCHQAQLVIGRGVRALVADHPVLVGSDAFMAENGVAGFDVLHRRMPELNPAAGRLYVARDNRLLGVIDTSSRLRGEPGRELDRCRALGVRHMVLLTGDHQAGARDLGLRFGFDEVHWRQSPEDKAAWIRAWKEAHPGVTIAMVGDGINDTPALATADLGFAIGEGGADVTVEYADIVLRRGGVDRVADTLAIGRRTLTTIRESYTLAIGFNAATLIATALGLLTPVAGALIHNLITIAVVSRAPVRPPLPPMTHPDRSPALPIVSSVPGKTIDKDIRCC